MATNEMGVNIQWGYKRKKKSKNMLIVKNVGHLKYSLKAFNITIIIDKVPEIIITILTER